MKILLKQTDDSLILAKAFLKAYELHSPKK